MTKSARAHFFILSIALSVFINSCGSDDPMPEPTCEDSGLTVTASNTSDATCVDGGQVTLEAEGGAAPYSYSLDAIQFTSNPLFTNLPAGSYIGFVKDDNNCTVESSSILIGAEDEAITFVVTQDLLAGCGSANGRINIDASGGTGSLSYKIDDSSYSMDNSFDDLTTGSHIISVKDEVGCESSSNIHVSSGVGYASTIEGQSESIMSIIESNCEGSTCHINGNQTDFSTYQNVKASAERIKSRTQDKSMPRNGSLTQEQIDLIACWVDDGALDN